jgi:hypothetical protein
MNGGRESRRPRPALVCSAIDDDYGGAVPFLSGNDQEGQFFYKLPLIFLHVLCTLMSLVLS